MIILKTLKDIQITNDIKGAGYLYSERLFKP
jgi:hypothetical protein